MKLVLGAKVEDVTETPAVSESADVVQSNVDENFSTLDGVPRVDGEENMSFANSEEVMDVAVDNEDEKEFRQNHVELLYENKEARNENGTHFVINDGSTKAIYKANSVRYYDKQEKTYKKVDNSLEDDGENLLTVSNLFKSRFSKGLKNGKIFDLEKDGCKVSLHLDGHADGCTLKACDCCGKEGSELLIENATSNTDIQYIVDSDRIKENIVVKEKAESYIYNFKINIDNLNVAVSEDGERVELKNKETGELEFAIPKPFMYDANDVYSDAVYYEIESQSDSLLTLNVIADPEFMNAENRAFPVIIDPQVIANDTSLFTMTTEYRNVYSSSSSGGSSYSNWYSYGSGLRIYQSTSIEYRSKINIKKSKLNLSGQKIYKATLKLRPYSVSSYGSCYLNNVYTYIGNTSDCEIDVTNNVRNYSGDFDIYLEPYSYGGSFNGYFYSSGTYAPILEVEYITNENTRPTIEEFSLAGCMSGALNLGTGEATAAFGDANTEGSALQLGVSHHYKKNSTVTNFGKNWRLNLEQRLDKNTNSSLDSNFIYTDAAGDKHGFKDFYYYLNASNTKVYISDKTQITVEQDGRLTYSGNEVFKEQKTSTGLKAMTKADGFKNIELIEQRQEEQIKLEDTLNSYKINLKDLVVVTTSTGAIVRSLSGYFSGDKLSKANFDTFINITTAQMVLPKGEAITFRNSRLQYDAMGLQDTAIGYQLTSIDQQNTAMGRQEIALDLQKCSLQVQKSQFGYYVNDEPKDGRQSLIDGVGSLTDPDQSWVVSQQIANIPGDKTLIGQQKTNLSNQRANVVSQRTNSSSQRTVLLDQINYIVGRRALYVDQAKKMYKEYVSVEHQLTELYKQIPVSYLIDQENVVRAFNTYGKLIAVYDAYENSAIIEYDTKDRIAAVYAGETKEISFKYNYYNQLTSITDSRGRKTKYAYSTTTVATANLTSVTYADGRKITFSYNSASGDITTVESSDKLRTSLTYTSGKPTSIITYSLAGSISKGSSGTTTTTELGRSAIAYQLYKTDMTDEKGKKVCYVFNADGNVSMSYTEQDGVLEDSYTHGFVNSTCAFTVKAKKGETNRLASVAAQTKSALYLLQTIQGNTLDAFVTDYMFGAYATANSNTTGMRMETAFYQQNMSTSVTAKFEIRADVVYPSETKQFIVSYDYANKNKQYAAVPVTLNEDENGNAVIPTQINLYVDYSSNSGSAVFDTFTFQEAEWEYKQLDQYGNPTLSETNWAKLSGTKRAKAETVYTYDDEQRLVKERKEQRTATVGGSIARKYAVTEYAYNPQGSLTRTESYIGGEETENGVSIAESFYDVKGRKTKEVKYNSLDSTTKFYAESEVSEKGVVTAEYDETGENKTVYGHIDGTNVAKTAVMPNGSKFGYGRGEYDEVTGITQSTAEGEGNSTQIRNDFGLTTELRSGNNTAEYVYDKKRRKKQIKLNGANHAEYVYEDAASDNGYVDKVTATLADGTTAETSTDRKGNVLTVKIGGVTQVTDTYDADGLRLTSADNVRGKTATYEYNDPAVKGRLTGVSITGADALSEAYVYNADGMNAQRDITHGGNTLTYNYAYKNNAAKDLDCITLSNGLKVYPQTDINGRGTGKLVKDSGGATKYGEYVYYRKAGDCGTGQVSSIRYAVNGNIIEGLKYAYDNMGNIAEVWENGLLSARYGYDGLNRLVREDNRRLNKTVLWTYDVCGNILSKRTAAYTVKPAEEIASFTEETLYGYDGTQSDRLTRFSGLACEYDALGNPTKYKGKTLTWQKGTQLSAYDTAGISLQFAYDGYGRRISKGATQYVYDANGKLFKQISGSDTLTFLYDGSGLSGVTHNGTSYIYRKNAMGDITHLFDLNGQVVVQYIYDAHGNHTVSDASGGAVASATHIGNLNPFRYRGYHYDTETGLFLLGSRYYDPVVGRFISPDSIDNMMLQSHDINGLNLYAYCLNNPIRYSDPTGGFVLTAMLIGLIVGAVVGGALVGAASYQIAKENGATGWELVGWTALGVLGGAVVGGAIGAGIGAFIGWAAPAIGSVLSAPAFSLAMGDVLVAVSVGQVATGLAALGGLVYFATERMGPGKHSNNQAQNKEIDYLQKKYGFDNAFRRALHDEITGQGYTKKIIEEIIKRWLGLL